MVNVPLLTDLDKSGKSFQGLKVYLGPSLGWVQTRVKPESFIILPGAYTLDSDAGVVLVNIAAAVTLTLPDVRAWVQEFAYNPATAFERAIWIKDLGGNATLNPIIVSPFSGQFIDLLSSFSINTNWQLVRLYPLSDLSGWFVG